jgi:hypothetical protein
MKTTTLEKSRTKELFKNISNALNILEGTHIHPGYPMEYGEGDGVFSYVPKNSSIDARVFIIFDETQPYNISINYHWGPVDYLNEYRKPHKLLTDMLNNVMPSKFPKNIMEFYNEKFYCILIKAITEVSECHSDYIIKMTNVLDEF